MVGTAHRTKDSFAESLEKGKGDEQQGTGERGCILPPYIVVRCGAGRCGAVRCGGGYVRYPEIQPPRLERPMSGRRGRGGSMTRNDEGYKRKGDHPRLEVKQVNGPWNW